MYFYSFILSFVFDVSKLDKNRRRRERDIRTDPPQNKQTFMVLQHLH